MMIMNKYIIAILAIFCVMGSCKKAGVEEYSHENGVYFQLFDNWSNKNDTLNYNFVKNELTEAAVDIRVNLQGIPRAYDREFVLRVNAEKSTAKEGVDFKALEPTYAITANEYYATIPVYLKRNAALKEKTLGLELYLEPTSDLILGFDDRQRAVIMFTDRLMEPYYWKNIISAWGAYSQVKQLTIERETGYEFPLTEEEYRTEPLYTRMQAAANYMNKWFGENVVMDENNQRILPWK